MKKIHRSAINLLCVAIISMSLITIGHLHGQTTLRADGLSHAITYTGAYQDFIIPALTAYNQIEFFLKGADGGYRRVTTPFGTCHFEGGEGATAEVAVKIGNGPGAIPLGRTIRLVVGGAGETNHDADRRGSGGGGGTGLLADLDGDLEALRLIAVAGGGGGAVSDAACSGNDGKGANAGTGGSTGSEPNSGSGGSNGSGGGAGGGDESKSAGGGGATGDGTDIQDTHPTENCDFGGGKKGDQFGGAGGNWDTNCSAEENRGGTGGFGYGGGGSAYTAGGGGGGYSGGGGGGVGVIRNGGGGGGGGYVTDDPAVVSSSITGGGTVEAPQDGYIFYQFTCTETAAVNITRIDQPQCQSGVNSVGTVYFNPSGCYDDIALLPGTHTITDNSVGNLQPGEYALVLNRNSQTVASETFTINEPRDTETPYNVVCKSSANATTFYIDNTTGEVNVTAQDLIQSASDNCGIGRITFLNGNLANTYGCNDVGQYQLGIRVYDYTGNSIASCGSKITIKQQPPSSLDNPLDYTVYLDANGEAQISTADLSFPVAPMHTCFSGAEIRAAYVFSNDLNVLPLDCSYVGAQTISLYPKAYSNWPTLELTLTVIDDLPMNVSVQDVNLTLDNTGVANLSYSDLTITANDNCLSYQQIVAGYDLPAGYTQFDCSDIGTQYITLDQDHADWPQAIVKVTVSANILNLPPVEAGFCSNDPYFDLTRLEDQITAASGNFSYYHPAMENIYIPIAPEAKLNVIDVATHQLVESIPVGSQPIGIAISPDQTKVAVANFQENTVSLVDATTNTVISTISTGDNPWSVIFSQDGSRIYVTNYNANTLEVFNSSTYAQVGAAIPVGDTPNALALSGNGNFVYVSNRNDVSVSVISTGSNSVVETIQLIPATSSGTARDITTGSDGSRIYVAYSQDANSYVAIIDVNTHTVIETIQVATNVTSITATPSGKIVTTNSIAGGSLNVIDLANNNQVTSILIGPNEDNYLNGISTNDDGTIVFVNDETTRKVFAVTLAAGTAEVVITNSNTSGVRGGFYLNNRLPIANPTQYTPTAGEVVEVDFSGGSFGCGATTTITFIEGGCIPFLSTWDTRNPGASGNSSITIPTDPEGSYYYHVDWNNDGIIDEFNLTGDATHDFGAPGVYTIAIYGDFNHIYFNNGGDREKIIDVVQWGDVFWKSMNSAFYGCTNLTVSATDKPKTSGFIDMTRMFSGATSFNSDVSHWDVGSSLFHTFENCASFNQDLSAWDVGHIARFDYAFAGATNFNQDLSSWDVSKAISLQGMFKDATAFDQNLGVWTLSSTLNSMIDMLSGSGLSRENYDNTLIGWAAQAPRANISLSSEGLQYCAGANARQVLVNTYNWTVTGDEEACDNCDSLDHTAPVADVSPLPLISGECSVSVTPPTATDDCAGTITATTTDPTGYAEQGTYTITWTYDDGNGNTSSQTQTVIVDDATIILLTFYADTDGDGFGDPAAAVSVAACSAPNGYTTDNTDCDDNDADEFPGRRWYKDFDDDGYSEGSTLVSCERPDGFKPAGELLSLSPVDCNDDDPSVNPDAAETCNGVDDNCDGQTDEGFDLDGDGYTTCDGDCDDSDPSVKPSATEICNGVDDNCDGQTDEGFDLDGDGYTTCDGDCDDSDAGVNPGVTETCNGVDDDCDGLTDNDDPSLFDNTPPVALCQNITVQLDANGNASTTADAVNNGSSDACGIESLALNEVDFDCSKVGDNILTLTVADGNGNTASCTATVTVESLTAENADWELAPNAKLWPPDYSYQTFAVSGMVIEISDVCGEDVDLADAWIERAYSDEAEDDPGTQDGNTLNDIVIGADCRSVQVRREKIGGGNGRVYTIVLAIQDALGNTGYADYKIQVPKWAWGWNSDAVEDNEQYSVSCGGAGNAAIISTGAASGGVLQESERSVQLYPNPFHSTINLKIYLPEQAFTTINIFDLKGRLVRQLYRASLASGEYQRQWDGTDDGGAPLPEGMYLIQVRMGDELATQKVTLQRL